MSYLDGGHLGVAAPAEALELLGVVAETHGPAIQHGAVLHLKLQVMQVWEVVIRAGPGGKTTTTLLFRLLQTTATLLFRL